MHSKPRWSYMEKSAGAGNCWRRSWSPVSISGSSSWKGEAAEIRYPRLVYLPGLILALYVMRGGGDTREGVTNWQELIVRVGKVFLDLVYPCFFPVLLLLVIMSLLHFRCRPVRYASQPGAGVHHPCLKLPLHPAAPSIESVISMQMPCAARGCWLGKGSHNIGKPV